MKKARRCANTDRLQGLMEFESPITPMISQNRRFLQMENELTVRVERPAIPAMSWNKDEVERNLDEMLAAYKGRVYTPESIKSAKEDRAKVNGWDKQLGAAATAAKKLYMKPLEDFQQSIKEMQGKCKEISGAIDAQVKAVEAAEKEEKASTLRLIYRDNIGELEALIPFERLLDNRWLNKTFAIAEAKKTLCQSIENIRSDLDFIRENCGEDVEPCTTEYLRNLSVNEAVREHTRREKSRAAQRDAEAAREAAERARMSAPVIVPPTAEEREMRAQAAAATQAAAFITPDGRLDVEAMQTMAAAQPSAPARKKYYFWVEFTKEDIAWFRSAAKERGFDFGSIK